MSEAKPVLSSSFAEPKTLGKSEAVTVGEMRAENTVVSARKPAREKLEAETPQTVI